MTKTDCSVGQAVIGQGGKKHPVVADIPYSLLTSNEDSGGKKAICVWLVPGRQFLWRLSLVTVFFYMRSSFRKVSEVAGVNYRIPLVQCTTIATVYREMDIDIFHRITDAVWRKSPEIWRNNTWFLLHDNAPAHRPVFVQGFPSKEQCDSTGTPPILFWSGYNCYFPVPLSEISIEETICDSADILTTLRTGLLNCLNARSRGLTFRHRASSI